MRYLPILTATLAVIFWKNTGHTLRMNTARLARSLANLRW